MDDKTSHFGCENSDRNLQRYISRLEGLSQLVHLAKTLGSIAQLCFCRAQASTQGLLSRWKVAVLDLLGYEQTHTALGQCKYYKLRTIASHLKDLGTGTSCSKFMSKFLQSLHNQTLWFLTDEHCEEHAFIALWSAFHHSLVFSNQKVEFSLLFKTRVCRLIRTRIAFELFHWGRPSRKLFVYDLSRIITFKCSFI